ncbi:MAG: hypothetical protein ACLFRD_11175, partial [Nitriliruptoraceae bacterium]
MSRQRRASVRPMQTTSAGLRAGWVAVGAALAGLGLLVAVVGAGLSGQSGPEGSSEALPELERAVDQSDEDEADDGDDLTADLAEAIPVAEDVYLSRDPFDPVVPEDEPEEGGADDDGNGGNGTDGDGSNGGNGDGTDGNGGGTSDPDSCQGDEELVCDGQVITLDRVEYTDGEPVAHFQVNATSYEVEPGDE